MHVCVIVVLKIDLQRGEQNIRGIFITTFAAGALGALFLPLAAEAQSYPIRPVRLVVPFPPGGTTDFTAREISQALSESLGQQFVVDNRSGAAGTMGHHIVAKAAPDGYTLVVGTLGGTVTGPRLWARNCPTILKKISCR